MRTLVDLIPRIRRLGDREAMRFNNGYRTWVLSYRDLYNGVAAAARAFEERGLKEGDRILLWGENRPEWIFAFWAAVVRGLQLVPVDERFSPGLVDRIQDRVEARLLVAGGGADPEVPRLRRLPLSELAPSTPAREPIACASPSPDDVVELVFTSGTTGEPKGVVHRHRNLCANLRPFQQELARYSLWMRPFQPIRILNLLPLSHMYGQSLGLFIPLLMGGSVVFSSRLSAPAIIETLRRERVSLLVAVPRMVRTVEEELKRRWGPFEVRKRPGGWLGVARSWWRYRRVHRDLGWKFWALAVGGAQLDPDSERFWDRLGLAVLQGYGLTETSPVIAVNHPLNPGRGSIGRVLPGVEVRLSPEGEILVRGDSVVTDYVGEQGGTLSGDGWFHTGDLGAIDAEGRLYFRGRKKDVIVTADGLNVHPRDVEAVLNAMPEVKESVAVARVEGAGEVVHAVLILEKETAGGDEIIGRANRRLESHQRIRGWSLWPERDFPRTASTLKVRRGEVARRVAGQGAAKAPDPVSLLLREHGPLADETRLEEDLGLSSLERIDLLSRLETESGTAVDDEQLSGLATVGDLRRTLAGTPPPPADAPRRVSVKWQQGLIVRSARRALQATFVLPLFRRYVQLDVRGLQHLERLQPPVIFAANHVSHLDTVAVLAALPAGWRRLVAPAVRQEYFEAFWRQGHALRARVRPGLAYFLARFLFNAYPLPQRLSGVRAGMKRTGSVVALGCCPLIYPEGRRTGEGGLLPFQFGVGLMSVRLRVPVVPVCHRGLFDIYSLHHDWPEPGSMRLAFGPPLSFGENEEYTAAAARVEEAVRRLWLELESSPW